MRTDARMVRTIVQDAARTWRYGWALLVDELREAVIDHVVMAHVRRAWAADNDAPITPSELLDLRDRVAAGLAGAPYGLGLNADREARCVEWRVAERLREVTP